MFSVNKSVNIFEMGCHSVTKANIFTLTDANIMKHASVVKECNKFASTATALGSAFLLGHIKISFHAQFINILRGS